MNGVLRCGRDGRVVDDIMGYWVWGILYSNCVWELREQRPDKGFIKNISYDEI